MKTVHLDIKKHGIRKEDIGNREVFRQIIAEARDLSEEKPRRTKGVLSE